MSKWINVELPWRITSSAEMHALNSKFIAAVNRANATWAQQNPDLAKLVAFDLGDLTKAFESQTTHTWMRDHLKAENVHTWREESLKMVAEVPLNVQQAYKILIEHRYAYALKCRYVNADAEIIEAQNQISKLHRREFHQQFCNHAMCQTGVLIEVRSLNDGIVSVSKMLIGDLTASGLDDGCCSSGLKDDDLIIAYKDLRYVLAEAMNDDSI